MYTAVNEYGTLKKALLCPPDYLNISEPINVIAAKYRQSGIDLERAAGQHSAFVQALRQQGVEVILADTDSHSNYQLNTRDLGATTPKGIIFGRFRLPHRRDEHRLAEKTLARQGIPIYHQIPAGTFEGGDFVFINEKKAALGTGARTDSGGVRSLELALHDAGLEIINVTFEEKYLHLDMLFNVIAEKTAVVCREALPINLLEAIAREGFATIEISPEEAFDHATNILPLGHKRLVSHTRIPRLNKIFAGKGFTVIPLEMGELQKSGGGPRCMSFPLIRASS